MHEAKSFCEVLYLSLIYGRMGIIAPQEMSITSVTGKANIPLAKTDEAQCCIAGNGIHKTCERNNWRIAKLANNYCFVPSFPPAKKIN